jgi:hypothetical protein
VIANLFVFDGDHVTVGVRRFSQSSVFDTGGCAACMHHDFGRIHKTLRVSRSMEASISDHVWSLEEIAALAN